MAFTVTEMNLIYRSNRGCGLAAVVMLVGILRYVFYYTYISKDISEIEKLIVCVSSKLPVWF